MPRVVRVGATRGDSRCRGGERRSRHPGGNSIPSKRQVQRVLTAGIQRGQVFSATREGLPRGPGATMRAKEARDEEDSAIQVRDVRSGSRTILHSGLLPASDAAAGGISFSPRRCAYRHGRPFATLQPSAPIDQAVLNTAEYFVTVRLGALDPSLVPDYPLPRAAMMEEVPDEASPVLRRLDADTKAQLFGGREIRVKRPTVAAGEARLNGVAAKRSLQEHPLVSMRVLVEKTGDGAPL